MDSITKAEIEEIERMNQRVYDLNEAIVNKKPNQVILGGYVHTMYKSDDDGKPVVLNRQYYRDYAKKASQELRKKIKANTREVLENG